MHTQLQNYKCVNYREKLKLNYISIIPPNLFSQNDTCFIFMKKMKKYLRSNIRK